MVEIEEMAGGASAVAGSIPKPVMRGLHQAQTKKHLVIAGVLTLVSVLAVKFIRNEPRKNDYAEFYRYN